MTTLRLTQIQQGTFLRCFIGTGQRALHQQVNLGHPDWFDISGKGLWAECNGRCAMAAEDQPACPFR